ncbi:MAG: hypothetical protein ACRDTT_31940, partial [Pseudonocardiaceae bacterium]
MPLARWLRDNAEHYLLVAAQDRIGRQYGVTRPRRPQGLEEIFWRRLFAPIYRLLPWTLRSRVLRAMPGSHRQQ